MKKLKINILYIAREAKRGTLMKRTSFFLILFLVCASISHSATITVPDDYKTIQAAIGSATSGDLIFVKPGTYEELSESKKELLSRGIIEKTPLLTEWV